jgi:fructuronate reductase
VPETELQRTAYSASSVGIGIVHLGFGAFHRAHQAAYIERWLNRNGGGSWGICSANIRSNAALVKQLKAQGFRYHIAEYADREHVRLTEISSIRNALFGRDDKEDLLAQMTAPTTRIVTLTVTEKGYYLNSASGELLLEAPDILHDISRPAGARTAPGLVLEALKRRRAEGTEPFTVLCCDNMPENGTRTRRAVSTLAGKQSAELARWIDSNVAFPSCMVDRIVPSVSEEAALRLDALIGFSDPVAVACEAFSQWVIEDLFPMGRPDWEADGVEMVATVEPHETMKLRMLNGAHSLLAYTGLLRGIDTVAEAIADQDLLKLLYEYFDEAAASLDVSSGLDTDAYRNALVTRFRNDALEHRLSQIAMDGSQKIPPRWLAGARINLEHGRSIRATVRAVAAWMAYVRGADSNGRQWQIEDPLAGRLRRCHQNNNADDQVAGLLAIREIFPAELESRADFRSAVRDAYMEAREFYSNA